MYRTGSEKNEAGGDEKERKRMLCGSKTFGEALACHNLKGRSYTYVTIPR